MAKLCRSLHVDAIVEPMRLFAVVAEDRHNPAYISRFITKQRPDIFLRNPRGLGIKIILDVAMTGIDDQSRTSDEAAEHPMQVRYEKKMSKYGRIAEQNNIRFIPAIISHTGQIHGEFKRLVKEQIRHKLICFEGEAKSSKVRSPTKWWSKCISMIITKTTSRN